MRLLCAFTLLICVAALAQPSNPRADNSVSCPDDHPYTGLRENWTFGFTIVIPENLKGHWNSAACHKGSDGCTCMGDHGTLIPLVTGAQDFGRQIEFYAELDSSDEHNLARLVTKWLRSPRESAREHTKIQKRTSYRLGGLNAERVVIRYYDPGLKAWYIEDFVVALRDGTVYTPYLRTLPMNYAQDLLLFNRILATFTLTKGEYYEDESKNQE